MEGTLVFGGTGFLGAWVVAIAQGAAQAQATFANPEGSPVWGIGRQIAGAPRFTDPRDGARWEALDLRAEIDLEGWLDERAPARVIGCAALARVADCEAQPKLAEALNSRLPGRVAAWCAGSGARYVHVSTDMVFAGEAPPGGYAADSPAEPLSVYGQSKLRGEEAVLVANPEALVVRLPLLYGNSGGRGSGASDSLLQQISEGVVPQLFVDEWRTPIEVSNAAEALVELADKELAGIVHLGGPERISRFDFGHAVLRAMGLPFGEAESLVQAVPREAGPSELWELRPKDASLDSGQLQDELETPLLGVREGLRRATS